MSQLPWLAEQDHTLKRLAAEERDSLKKNFEVG